MSTENREVAYLKDKPLSEDYAYVYGELEDGSIVKVSKEQLGNDLNSKLSGLIKSQEIGITTDSDGDFNIGLISSKYIVVSAIPIRDDAEYYTGFYTVSVGVGLDNTLSLKCIDDSGNNLANKSVKVKYYYYEIAI